MNEHRHADSLVVPRLIGPAAADLVLRLIGARGVVITSDFESAGSDRTKDIVELLR